MRESFLFLYHLYILKVRKFRIYLFTELFGYIQPEVALTECPFRHRECCRHHLVFPYIVINNDGLVRILHVVILLIIGHVGNSETRIKIF